MATEHYGVFTRPGVDGAAGPVLTAATAGDAVKYVYDGWTRVEKATAANAAAVGLGAAPVVSPTADADAEAEPEAAPAGHVAEAAEAAKPKTASK